MQTVLNIAQIVAALLLAVAILLQNRGAGLGVAFGGESQVFAAKRGPEKALYIGTIVLSVIFLSLSLVNVLFF